MIPVGGFTDADMDPVVKAIKERVAAGDKDVYLAINSPGGSVDTMVDLVNTLAEAQKAGVHVTCVNMSHAYSAGAYLMESTGCDTRWALPYSRLLFHEAAVGTDAMHVDELRGLANRLEATNHMLVAATAKRLLLSSEAFAAKILNNDWVLGPDEALAQHAVDAIKDPRELPPLATLTAPEDPLTALLNRLKHQ